MNTYEIVIQALCTRQPTDPMAIPNPTAEEAEDIASNLSVVVDAASAKEAMETVSHALTTLVNTQRGRR